MANLRSWEGETCMQCFASIVLGGYAWQSFSISLQSPEEDEQEDFRVLPTDNLLAIGKAEEDYSSVEVHGKNNSHLCVA